MSEEIVLPPLSSLITGIQAENCVGIQLNYNLTGGTFSISLLPDVFPRPAENAQFTLPNGRIATVKNVGRNFGAGILDIISGPIVPPIATLITLVGIPNNVFVNASILARRCASGIPLIWRVFDPKVRSFIYRGVALNGIVQLASYLSAEVIVRSDGVYVVNPGTAVGSIFNIPKADIVNANQSIDYSQDVPSILNPALSLSQLIPDGQFVYDSDHAQKQAKTTVQAGAPGAEGSSDFIPIPDGWLVDGNFEEWAPQSATDLTNPAASPLNGRYWKIYQSPVNPGMLRGITNFTRLIKIINLPGNVSTFVGSPVTGDTLPDTGRAFAFDQPGTENGIYGFTAGDSGPHPVGVTFFDVISHQFYTFPTAIILVPAGSIDSGDAASSFFSITMEIWTFPRVNPKTFPIGNPVNPFNLPKDATIVNPPMNNVIFGDTNSLITYWEQYMNNFRLINSPRLRTTISCVFRGLIPQPGDTVIVGPGALQVAKCGRISSVSLNLSRTGLVLNIVAEIYQYGKGLFNKYPPLRL